MLAATPTVIARFEIGGDDKLYHQHMDQPTTSLAATSSPDRDYDLLRLVSKLFDKDGVDVERFWTAFRECRQCRCIVLRQEWVYHPCLQHKAGGRIGRDKSDVAF